MTETSTVSSHSLLRWRKEFPILEDSVYLINNSLGAMPAKTGQSLQEYADAWGRHGIGAWDEAWWELPGKVGDLVGSIIGAGPGEVSLHQNVSIAEWIAFSCLRPTPKRNRVVYSELNFPTIRYFYQAQPDLEIVTIPSEDGVTVPIEAMLEAIDERTLVVPISHVIFKSCFLQDARSIIQKAQSVGAVVILDIYQSCGVVPIDVSELPAEFMVGGSIKWLCGGPGVGFLRVRPDLISKLEPRLTGWMAHRRPFQFAERMEYAQGAYRFLNGTPNIPSIYAARSGFEIIAAVGTEAIRERSQQLTQRIIEWADEFGFAIQSPRDPRIRGGHVSVNPPQAVAVSRELLRRRFMVDYRPDAGIRVAPHFFNTEEEVDQLMREMHKIVRQIGQG